MTLNLNRMSSYWNRDERIKINNNWDKIEKSFNGVTQEFDNAVDEVTQEFDDVVREITQRFDNAVDEVTQKAYDEIIDAVRDLTKINWLAPVPTYNDIETTYPNPTLGDITITSDDGSVYRYDGEQWVFINKIDPDVYMKLQDDVTAIQNGLEQLDNKVMSHLAELQNDLNNTKDFLIKNQSLILNSDFKEMPYIFSRSSVYSFSLTTERIYKNNNSLKIVAADYENNQDENKDFAFLLTEVMRPGEKLKIHFYVYPTDNNKKMSIRLAYSSSGIYVDLGQANQWNKIEVELDLSAITRGANYLYFDLLSSQTIYISDLVVLSESLNIDNISSLNQINKKIEEQPNLIQNSNGIIGKMIEVAQTFHEQLNNFVYGNSYTAFDNETKLVDGKYQVDCSSFAHLLINGITFQNSRYNGNDNISSDLFFTRMDPYKFRYANQMARFAHEKGYAFYPDANFSNLRPGDVLFFSWNDNASVGDTPEEARSANFMRIDHVAVFLHKKNENIWSTLQINNNVSTVYVDVDFEYMSQCVLVARFPYAFINEATPSNLIVNGNSSKSVENGIDVGFYRLVKPLEKGKYYSLFIDGEVYTENCYFTVLINNKIVYSDYGRSVYGSVLKFKFPYLLDDVTKNIKISIGSSDSSITERSAIVNWVSLYEGYIEERKYFEQPINYGMVYDFPLNENLKDDLDLNLYPYYKYVVDGNKLFLNLNLPFKTFRTGHVLIGSLPPLLVNTQRIPINLIGSNNEAINGILQVNTNGSVTIIVYDVTKQWRYVTANGCIFIE